MRWNGRLYEWLSAWRERRVALDLYHAGLMLHLDDVTYAIEMGPVWNVPATDRGVVFEGPVGTRWLGSSRMFRYEVRCWAGGQIPDIAEAVDSPMRTTQEPTRIQNVLALLRAAPPLTWGRDELGTGEMWNSNSMVAWVVARSGHEWTASDHRAMGGHRDGTPAWFSQAGASNPRSSSPKGSVALFDRRPCRGRTQAPVGQMAI